MRSKAIILGSLVLIMLWSGCRKDPSLQEVSSPSGPTPYSLKLPSWMHAEQQPFIPWDNPMTVEGIELGRKLFYEKALSDDFTMSCGTCHQQEHAFSDPRQFSIGTDGSVGRRNSMAIVNLAWDDLFFWDGRAQSLELQAFMPVVDHAEMRNTWPVVVERLQAHAQYPSLFEKAFGTSDIDSVLVVKAIAQFERTLISFNTRFDRFEYGGDSLALTQQEMRGMDLFFRGAHCADCHRAPLLTDHAMRNNGLDQVHLDLGFAEVTGITAHEGRFKTTTLRNIEVTAPYMHDSRFNTLEEVMDHYAEGVHLDSPNLDNHMLPWMLGEVSLSVQDRADLVAFLKTLTDQEFLNNPAFSDPH
jgi:cytochrome c peroxidase